MLVIPKDTQAKDLYNMPGTRSAPTVDGTPDFLLISFSWIDYVGDRYSAMIPASGTTATPAEIEALAVALQAASNASLWRIQVTQDYQGLPLKSNALEEVWNDAEDVVVIHYKNPSTRSSEYMNFPAPLDDIFVEGTEQVDTADALFTAILAAVAAILPSGFNPATVRFSKHKEVNQAELIG
jgi:hypothetical protein